MERLTTLQVKIGDDVVIGGGAPVVVQTMCNTHTSDVQATVAQCLELAAAGAQMIRITVPGLQDVPSVREIHTILRGQGCRVPLVADIHFSADTAIACAQVVEKVRINPGNFHPDHQKARSKFAEFLEVCKAHGTAVRVGHVVVSLKASNTVVMVQAYRELVKLMKERKLMFPLHLGVTEAGNGDAGRIKSCVGIASLLREGIGDTIRVSLTEPPVKEIPVARHIVDYFSRPEGFEPDPMLDAAILWGPRLLDREIDAIPADAGLSPYLEDEIMQASRRRFYRPEYIACPGCGRTMYRLEETFEEVKRRTAHLKGMVIAVMGCIVNGPGEMADADWGYVGEGGGRVSIYHNGQRVLAHIPDNEAIDKLLELIEKS